jgi:hypothetical protein
MVKWVITLCLIAASAQANWFEVWARGMPVGATSWTPPDASNLLIWFDGFTQSEIDNGIILDSSGNGYNAVQTNATKRGTIVDSTAIKGNGTSSSWTLAGMGHAISNFTIVAICKPASDFNKHFFTLSDNPLSSWDLIRLGHNYISQFTTTELAIWHDAANVATVGAYSYGKTNDYSCVAGVYVPNNLAEWCDGYYAVSDTSCLFTITTNLPAASTFLSYGQTYFSDNSIKALLFYKSALTTNQLTEIKAHYLP